MREREKAGSERKEKRAGRGWERERGEGGGGGGGVSSSDSTVIFQQREKERSAFWFPWQHQPIMKGSDLSKGGRGREKGWTERSGLLFTFGSRELSVESNALK